jgi:hypothetical protein
MDAPLFSGELADFIAVEVNSPGDRSQLARVHRITDSAEREQVRKKLLRESRASYGRVEVTRSGYTTLYRQTIEHPRLSSATRQVELWNSAPRARVTVRFDRISSRSPEVLYLAFAFPVGSTLPLFSTGGMQYIPYRDQLPGSCRDYYAIDSWAQYSTPAGDWLWVTRDAPLVAVGGPHTLELRTEAPSDTHRLVAMIFDNFWHTNFVADSNGTMEFQFDLAWRHNIPNPSALATTLLSEPWVVLNSSTPESPALTNTVFRP